MEDKFDASLQESICERCHPFVSGWCKYVEETKGKMLDEKCPKVRAFVNGTIRISREGEIK